ncbi:Transcriptional regulator [Alteracholeplasma palmae J233]|uniref:Transcriptional regulator n=1 Tax=Alteracholeplasma palmae (strain ATCC 49389 / J233) TaxID=1318466 RepID=U4KJL2_ALTPJ|nr:PadR family transcriptional regulator [Alteracholeplasma palmae]CCV63704.1 Transcriptional regulator [Alteracholeplasma palmae J233]
MDIQLKKGLLDTYVLHVLLDGPTYGYELYARVIQDFTISESTLYPIFRRLEKENYVSTYQEEHNGRLRKYYQITELGKVQLKNAISELQDLNKVINKIIIGGLKNE